MDILGKARTIESHLTRTIDRAAQRLTKTAPAEPLEIMQAIVETVDEHILPAGRGTHVFPFNRIDVSILAPSDRDRARFEAVFESVQPLDGRIADRLHAAGCGLPALDIRTRFVEQRGDDWMSERFHVTFERTAADVPVPTHAATIPNAIAITILQGSADKPSYTFAVDRLNLGRCAEVRDQRNHLVRINHVAFDDVRTEPNHSVSRQHAHIEHAADSRGYRICDDRSGHGTNVVRNGRTLPVPPGPRGIRLESGDEILLGEARLRVDF